MSECTQCGKRTTPDSIHTCSPQVLRDETLPEPTFLRRQQRRDGGYNMVPAYTADEMRSYAASTLREAIKGARKKALTEALAAMDDTEEPRWYGYECPNTWQDGKWQTMASARKLLEDEQ